MNQSESSTPGDRFAQILQFQTPAALAWVRGNTPYAPGLSGMVRFYDTPYGGVLIEGEFFQLPNKGISSSTDFYALHIHENGDCSAGFTRTGGHYNPTGTYTPGIPAIFCLLWETAGMDGLLSYDKRFTVKEIMGRSVVLHSGLDDFTSQPSRESWGCDWVRGDQREVGYSLLPLSLAYLLH